MKISKCPEIAMIIENTLKAKHKFCQNGKSITIHLNIHVVGHTTKYTCL